MICTIILLGGLKGDKFGEISDQIKKLIILSEKVSQLKLSSTEFAYLKIIAFTSSGKFVVNFTFFIF